MATFGVETQIRGLNQCLNNLESLGSTKARAVSRRALQSASSEPLKAAKKLVPRETGQLKKSLGKRVKTYRSTGTTFIAIGPRPGYKNPETGRNPAKYAHLVELGTTHSPAQPFLRPALMQTKDRVISAYRIKLWESIRREVERMPK